MSTHSPNNALPTSKSSYCRSNLLFVHQSESPRPQAKLTCSTSTSSFKFLFVDLFFQTLNMQTSSGKQKLAMIGLPIGFYNISFRKKMHRLDQSVICAYQTERNFTSSSQIHVRISRRQVSAILNHNLTQFTVDLAL